jgi:hypothetical protein
VRILACTPEKPEHLQVVCVYLKETLSERADSIQWLGIWWCGGCMLKNNEKFEIMYLGGIKSPSNLKILPYLKLKYF